MVVGGGGEEGEGGYDHTGEGEREGCERWCVD